MISTVRRALKSIIRFWAMHRRSPITWIAPDHADVVVFDAMGADEIIPLLNGRSSYTLSTRGERLVLAPSVIFRMVSNMLSGASPIEAYALALIAQVSPKLVITFIDNNSAFSYAAAHHRANFIAIQNGARTMKNEAPDDPSKVVLPTFFCIGQNDVDQFTKAGCLVGAFRPVGSLRNDRYARSEEVGEWPERFDVCLLSEVQIGTEAVPELFQNVRAIAAATAEGCRSLGLKVCVAARSNPTADPKNFEFEAAFYRSFFGEAVRLIPNDRAAYSTYRVTDSSSITVASCSTGLYEAVQRGRRILVSGIVPDFYEFPVQTVWALRGPDQHQFTAALDHLMSMSDAEFHATYEAEVAYLVEKGVSAIDEIKRYVDDLFLVEE